MASRVPPGYNSLPLPVTDAVGTSRLVVRSSAPARPIIHAADRPAEPIRAHDLGNLFTPLPDLTDPPEQGWYWVLRKEGGHGPEVCMWDGTYFLSTVPNKRLVLPEDVADWVRIDPPVRFLEPAPN